MSDWYFEYDKIGLKYGYEVSERLFLEKSEFQTVEVFETKAMGRMLLIDDLVMITDNDEFVYHEMLSHIPMCYSSMIPKSVLVVGGGDGGTVTQLVKYPQIEKITLAELDPVVIDASRRFFPEVAKGLNDPRVDIALGDAVDFVKTQSENSYDLVLIDSTDPIGFGEGLFSKEFYANAKRICINGGIVAAQSESPWYKGELVRKSGVNLNASFEFITPYIGSIPTYPRGLWSWTIGSDKKVTPGSYNQELFNQVKSSCRYLNDDIMSSVFSLPEFYKKELSNT